MAYQPGQWGHQSKLLPLPNLGTYLSPPEQPMHDSFVARTSQSQSPGRQMENSMRASTDMSKHHDSRLNPISPPVSPRTRLDEELGRRVGMDRVGAAKDPFLFPHHDHKRDGLHPPLFPQPEQSQPEQSQPEQRSQFDDVIDSHMAAKRNMSTDGHSIDNNNNKSRADYELALSFKAKIADHYNKDPQAYIAEQWTALKAYPSRFPQGSSGGQTAGVKRPNAAVEQQSRTSVKQARIVRKAPIEKLPASKKVRVSPRDKVEDSFMASPSTPTVDIVRATPERKFSRATPQKEKDDTSFQDLADYSPPLASLDGKSFKVDWKGNPLDMSKDPHRDLLHPSELNVASTLRLNTAVYLGSKRRIFIARLECYKQGKDFKKTTAQQACKIDVNKASKLWSAFDKVGWFDDKWMENIA